MTAIIVLMSANRSAVNIDLRLSCTTTIYAVRQSQHIIHYGPHSLKVSIDLAAVSPSAADGDDVLWWWGVHYGRVLNVDRVSRSEMKCD